MLVESRFRSSADVARRLCDKPAFRIAVAIVPGLPLAAFSFAAAVHGGLALMGLVVGIVTGVARPGELAALATSLAFYGCAVIAFVGVALRLVFTSAALEPRPRLRRAVLILLTVALGGLGALAAVQSGPYILIGLMLVALCWLGTLRPKSAGPMIST